MTVKPEDLTPGQRVTVDAGRHRGLPGWFLRHDLVQSGQLRVYCIVQLDSGETVRVVTATPIPNDRRNYWRCPRCGAALPSCARCEDRAQCGDIWCVEHSPDGGF